MERRQFVELVGKATLLAVPAFSGIVAQAAYKRLQLNEQRFVYIAGKDQQQNRWFLSEIGPRLAISHPEWERDLVRLDEAIDGPLVFDLLKEFGPATRELDGPIIARLPDTTDGRSFPEVELWNNQWLQYAILKEESDCYPISGGWWSVDGDWNPSWQKVRDHLFHSPNHTEGEFEDWWLDQLIFEELQSLHSDHHREMTRRGRVHWDRVNQDCEEG